MIIAKTDALLRVIKPEAVLILGDTNSSLAAIAAAAGAEVPPRVLLTDDAYRRFVSEGGLAERIAGKRLARAWRAAVRAAHPDDVDL